MATIKYIRIAFLCAMIAAFGSCTKYNYIDGGLSDGVHDCTMWEYFHKDSRNWDSTILMIERAGLRSLFDGTGEYNQITFFGLTGLSIERHIQNHNKGMKPTDPQYWRGVNDIPVAQCKDIIQKLVVPGRIMLKDVPRGTRFQVTEEGITGWKETGGKEYRTVGGGELFVWTQREAYDEVEDTGAFSLWIASRNQSGTNNDRIASTDIQTTTGVVHSLNYDFRFINF